METQKQSQNFEREMKGGIEKMIKQIKNLAVIAGLAFLPSCANMHSNKYFSNHESNKGLYKWEIPSTVAMQTTSPLEISASQKYVQDYKSQFENPYLEMDIDSNNDHKITLKEQEEYLK